MNRPLRIIYIAKHDSGGNEDENAIADALRYFGHQVYLLSEQNGRKAQTMAGDFVLFHKWHDITTLRMIEIPKVFYYFDLVDFPDSYIGPRNLERMKWMQETIPLVDIGFCTDGMWVNNNPGCNLIWLTQGADQRKVGRVPGEKYRCESILMTGIKNNGGRKRKSFVEEMQIHYGDNFVLVERGIHGENLARFINSFPIIVAPDGPVAPYYWSNRVFLTLGYGGFLLHPYCEGLTKFYKDKEEIVYYHNRQELRELIHYYLKWPDKRREISEAGLRRTIKEHTYLHRCETMLEIITERLKLK